MYKNLFIVFTIFGYSHARCFLNSVYLIGADDALGFAGGFPGYPGLDGCYTFESSLSPVVPGTIEEIESDHGVYLKEGLFTDGPGFLYKNVPEPIWEFHQFEYKFSTTDADYLSISEDFLPLIYVNSDSGSPADTSVWIDGKTDTSLVLEVRCGCSDTSPIISPTPRPVTPTPRPVSPTPVSKCTSKSVDVKGVDDAIGFAGGLSGYPGYDGCYTSEPSVSTVTDSLDSVDSDYGVFFKDGLFKDGPHISHIPDTDGDFWSFSMFDYKPSSTEPDYKIVDSNGGLYSISGASSPADVREEWIDRKTFEEVDIFISCGCSNTFVDSSDDFVVPESSDDVVVPESSDDFVVPESSDDFVVPESSDDFVVPESSDDFVVPESSDDFVVPESLVPESSDDVVVTESPDDIVVTESPDDIIVPESSDDVVVPESVSGSDSSFIKGSFLFFFVFISSFILV